MRRRTFLIGSAATLVSPSCFPDAIAEQPTKLPVIGYLAFASPGLAPTTAVFLGD